MEHHETTFRLHWPGAARATMQQLVAFVAKFRATALERAAARAASLSHCLDAK